MGNKSIDELRIELGILPKKRQSPRTEYVNINLHFRFPVDDAKRLLLKCQELNTSESLFARQAILDKIE